MLPWGIWVEWSLPQMGGASTGVTSWWPHPWCLSSQNVIKAFRDESEKGQSCLKGQIKRTVILEVLSNHTFIISPAINTLSGATNEACCPTSDVPERKILLHILNIQDVNVLPGKKKKCQKTSYYPQTIKKSGQMVGSKKDFFFFFNVVIVFN